MTDLISRADAIEAVQTYLNILVNSRRHGDDFTFINVLTEIRNKISALPSANAVSREKVKEQNNVCSCSGDSHVTKSLGGNRIPHTAKDCTELIQWLLEEVMDEEMWELNAVGNGEIICRKLKNLGLLEVKDGYYIRPSADAVHGEWIDIDNHHRLATCSHCRKVTMFEKWGEYTKPYDFCPNCGARMEANE